MAPVGAIPVSWFHLALASALVGVAIAISLWQQLGMARGFVVAAVRAVVQLSVVGYVLVFIFDQNRWELVLLAIVVMLVAATFTATDRISRNRRKLLMLCGLALSAGAGLTVVYVDLVVLTVRPWYNPQYLIPLFGMIVSNAMNGAALAAERLNSEMVARSAEVEAYLALGASPAYASREATRAALTAALLPTLNGLAIVGLVSLPGMMTGQILSGTSPLLAVRYQIVVMFMLTSAVALSAVAVVLGYRRSFFTHAEQLSNL